MTQNRPRIDDDLAAQIRAYADQRSTELGIRLSFNEAVTMLLRRALDDAEETYRCAICSAKVGIFIDHGDGWWHYRGSGRADDPNELYTTDHAPVAPWDGDR